MIALLLALLAYLLGPAPAPHGLGVTAAPAPAAARGAVGASPHGRAGVPPQGAGTAGSRRTAPLPPLPVVPPAAASVGAAQRAPQPPAAPQTVAACPPGLLLLTDGPVRRCVEPAPAGAFPYPPGARVIGPGDVARNADQGD